MVDLGSIQTEWIESLSLVSNPHQDDSRREIQIYIPPGFDSSSKPCSALLGLAGFGGSALQMFSRDPFGEDLKTKMDRLITKEGCPSGLIVLADCFNRFGGTQYLDSTAVGAYESFLVKDVVPWITKKYRVKNWGVFGKSSGGYGALGLAGRNPDVFEVFADHSGDAHFELCYLPDFPAALDQFRRAGGPARFLDGLWKDVNRKRKKYFKALNVLAMAAHYSPNPQSPHLGVDFPFDLESGEFQPNVWDRWREWDSVNIIPRLAKSFKKLRFHYLDCGSQDEYALHWGARGKRKAFEFIGVHPYYEEFEDGHSNLSYRFDVSVPKLLKALA